MHLEFEQLKLTTPLKNAITDLGFEKPTTIQLEAFNVIAAGKDVVGIAQTGTGKTYAYMMPILRNLKYSEQEAPRVLILVPTRELVVQLVDDIEKLTKYMNVRVLGVFGGTNINTQKKAVADGQDIIVATPGRLYDLALSRVLQLKSIKQLVVDEIDIMLDLGFRHQLINIIDMLPPRKQNMMFSATMTEDVDRIISGYLVKPTRISVAVSGTRLQNIKQTKYYVPNYRTKLNLIIHLLNDAEIYNKVLIFVGLKSIADRLYEQLDTVFPGESAVIHSNKSQNYRLNSIAQFAKDDKRILIATDIMARGLDVASISHVVNLDVPAYPENYMHRIGRTGRAENTGHAVLLVTEKEIPYLKSIENLMNYELPELELPEEVIISDELMPEEKEIVKERYNPLKANSEDVSGPAFHDKKEKNKKENLGGSYRREVAKKYKKPKTRGDKNYNRRKKK